MTVPVATLDAAIFGGGVLSLVERKIAR